MIQGTETLSPAAREALLKTAEDLGLIEPRLRCAMPEFASSGLSKWASPNVTLSQSVRLHGLTPDEVAGVFADACGAWNRVCGIKLAVVSPAGSMANIISKAGRIDGSSGTLAYSYLPGTPSPPTDQLSQMYDDAEGWTKRWLLEVVIHEIGHAIGLSHSPDRAAIMYPYAHGGNVTAPQSWDITEARARYGAPVPTPPTVPPATSPTIAGVISVGGVTYQIQGVSG